MKRDNNLIPLSRDHHYSLLFCWKVRKGLETAVDLDRIRLYILYFWRNNLKDHFQEEETLLFRDRPDPLCVQAIDDHRRIRELIQSIRGSGFRIRSNYSAVADLVDRHIRFEERQVFPFLEQRLSKEQLSSVGARLNQLHQLPTDDLYEDAFWS